MVVIRLQRRGTKKTPHHRIVVADRRHAQRGRVLEILGHYDPSREPPLFSLNEPRLVFWTSSGAQVSDAVAHLVKRYARKA
ncbi:MAG: 30S ribosomal protein S16 [Candidatus Omnitrophica bacterium]|nr:30S ribosomal protein S16 [Candidatus Omnitrophota bacterium]